MPTPRSRFPGLRAATLAVGALACAVAALAGCSAPGAPQRSVADLRLVGGGTVATVAGRTGRTLILIADPGDCFACNGDVLAWTRRSPAHSHRVRYVASDVPSPREQAALTIARIAVAAVLADSVRGAALPAAYLFHDGRLLGGGSLRDTAATNVLHRHLQ